MLITVEQLFAFAAAGVIMSLAFEFFPKLHVWFDALSDNYQRLVVIGSGVVVVLGAFGLVCLNVLMGLPWVCTWFGALDALVAFFAYIFATQATWLITPKVS